MACTYCVAVSSWPGLALSVGTYIGLVRRETVVDAGREDNEVVLSKVDAHPGILLAPDIKVALATADVANLFVLMQVLVEKGLDLFFVDGAHLLRRDKDFVAVLVAAVLRQLVHARNIGDVVVQDAQLGQVLFRDSLARVVRQALVAL